MNSWRNQKPEPAESINFNMLPHQNFNFGNGLNCYFIKKDNLPIVRVNVIINSGSKHDPSDKKGLANLLSMSIDEGAGEYDALQLSEQFDLLGAHFSVYANSDSIQIVVQALTENFPRTVELLSKVLMSPRLQQDDFEREKRKILTKLKQLQDDPDFLASTAFEQYLLGKENPYSFPTVGFSKSINDISNEDVKSFYKKNVIPNNIFFVIVGNLELQNVNETLSNYFSSWEANSDLSKLSISKKVDEKVLYVVNKNNSVQTEIRIGHQTTGRKSNDYFAKHLLNTILGGQFTSRINLNLREKHGYTYGAGSGFNYFKDSAYFLVSTSVGIENTSNALNEIFKELKNIKNGVTQKEVEFAKNSIIQKFPLNFETNRQIASNFIGKVMFNLSDDYFETYIDKIKSVNINEINKAAEKYILPEIATTVLVGDKDKLRDSIDESEFGKIIYKEMDL